MKEEWGHLIFWTTRQIFLSHNITAVFVWSCFTYVMPPMNNRIYDNYIWLHRTTVVFTRIHLAHTFLQNRKYAIKTHFKWEFHSTKIGHMFQEYTLWLFVTKEHQNMDFLKRAILLVNSFGQWCSNTTDKMKSFYTQRKGNEKGRSW